MATKKPLTLGSQLGMEDRPLPIARCGDSAPHGAHVFRGISWCAGNVNVITAKEKR